MKGYNCKLLNMCMVNIFVKIYNILQTSTYDFGKVSSLKTPYCNICFHAHKVQWIADWSTKEALFYVQAYS